MFNKSWYQLITILSISVLLISCNNNSGTGTSTSKMNTKVTNGSLLLNGSKVNSLFGVGGTYDTMSSHPTPIKSCLSAANNSDNFEIDNPQAKLDFTQEQSLSSVQSALGIYYYPSVGFGPLEIGILYSYARSSQDDNFTLNMNYIYQYSGTAKFKNNLLVQGEGALTNTAKDVLESSPTAFRQMCGDRYVAELNAGASVLMRISLKFDSHVEKNYYDDSFKDIGWLQNVLDIIKQNPNHIHYSLSASGIQVGGNADLLNQLFIKYGGNIGTDGYPVLNCGTNEHSNPQCVNLINEVINYAKSLKGQLNSFDDYYLFNPVALEWKTIGIYPGDVSEDPQILEAMRQLTQQYHQDESSVDFIKSYKNMLSSKNALSAEVNNYLDKEDSNFQNIMAIYKNPNYHLADCYNGFVSTSCLSVRDNILNTRNQILSDKRLNQFFDYLLNSQYIVSLYISPDYGKTADCMLSPITDEEDHLFMVNCNGQVSSGFDKYSGISIFSLNSGSNLLIKNLNYHYSKDNNLIKYTYNFNQPLFLTDSYRGLYSGDAYVDIGNGQNSLTIFKNVIFKKLKW
jgi:hypothetical protein